MAVRHVVTSRRGLVLCTAAGLAAAGASPLHAASTQAAAGPGAQGSFSAPFQEAGIPNATTPCTSSDSFANKCVPTAVSAAILANGKVLYWNGLEGIERPTVNTVAQFGAEAPSDQSRVLDLSAMTWTKPSPVDGGGTNAPPDLLVPGTPYTQGSSDALFCSSLVQLSDGRVMATGGTDYYDEPGVPGTTFGVSELQGLRNTRVFDPATDNWSQTGLMNYGRWYPTTVTLADGRVFVASGVTKLIKPVYSNAPTNSGTNVEQTETYSPVTGTWTYNGTSADHSLPLFPRLHLLPDGEVYYDAGGQTFNPDGQSYDEATWNIAAAYDPAARTWKSLGIPGVGTDYPGFKGSTFSLMLPLAPPYTTASFLSAGGVYGVTPGSYLATNASTITTIDTSAGDRLTTRQTGNLNNRRWYSTGVVLPDETVMAFSGSLQDGVVGPGAEIPVHQAELFDPTSGTWRPMASGHRDRTYHNTAELLPDGSVLVGGHSPITTGYAFQTTLPGGVTANNGKDPSFEIYYPPYYNAVRPTITGAPGSLAYGGLATISTPDAASIAKVVLVRNTSITHLVDGDQRTVVVPVVSRTSGSVTVAIPSNRAVLPPGPYLLFVDSGAGPHLVPSKAAQTFVGAPAPAWATPAVVVAHTASTTGTLAAPHLAATGQSPAAGTAPSAGRVTTEGRLGVTRLSASTAPASVAAGHRWPATLVAALLALMAGALAARRRLLMVRRH